MMDLSKFTSNKKILSGIVAKFYPSHKVHKHGFWEGLPCP